MEALERAYLRLQQKTPTIDPVIIQSVEDIKRVLVELDPKTNHPSPVVTLKTRMQGQDEKGNQEIYEVEADTKSRSKRDMLLEGLQVIKNRLEASNLPEVEAVLINDRPMKPAALLNNDIYCWVDPLIRQWLGGYRKGMLICWDLSGYTYKYDLYAHKLTRIENA